MKVRLIKAYIEKYKSEFKRLHRIEIYKWHAIKQFQSVFDIQSDDLYSNLARSLEKSGNLLDSSHYFPRKMLLENTDEAPEEVRKLLKSLFDENEDILNRVDTFKSQFGQLSKKVFPQKKNHYQDHRAIIVYLTLMYPERYFLYKFGMFSKFASKIQYEHIPIKGRIENIGAFQSLCSLIRHEIINDQELLSLHENRLDENCYRDINFNVLTQDFIYAVAKHLPEVNIDIENEPEIISEEEISSENLETHLPSLSFTPKVLNYNQINQENKRIGDLGELWVYANEKRYLVSNGKENLAAKVEHVAKKQGDGLGYDILSYDLNGNKKYIEVKTTCSGKNTPFFVTRNELEKSLIENQNYFLYRVFNYDEDKEEGDLLKINGKLSSICETPVTYKIILKD